MQKKSFLYIIHGSVSIPTSPRLTVLFKKLVTYLCHNCVSVFSFLAFQFNPGSLKQSSNSMATLFSLSFFFRRKLTNSGKEMPLIDEQIPSKLIHGFLWVCEFVFLFVWNCQARLQLFVLCMSIMVFVGPNVTLFIVTRSYIFNFSLFLV